MISLKDLLKEILLKESELSFINNYIEKSKYDILNSWGSCAFYTKDWLDTIGGEIIYMPYGNIKKYTDDGTANETYEDHIVPLYKGYLIDFAKVPNKGVAKADRPEGSTPPKLNPGSSEDSWPRITKFSEALFEPGGLYGKLGYVANGKYDKWHTDPEPNGLGLKEYYPIREKSFSGKLKFVGDGELQYPSKKQLKEMSAGAVNKAPQGVLFLDSNKILVGDNHHDSVELSDELFDTLLKIAKKYGYYGEGKGIGYNKGVVSSEFYKALTSSGAQYKGSWDDKVQIPSSEKYAYLATIFSNPTENKRVPRLMSKVKDNDTIWSLLSREMSNHTQPGLNLNISDLKKFLEEASENGIDFIQLSKKSATEKNVQDFIDKGEKLTWPSNWEKYPNKAGKLARKETILRDTWLIEKAPPGIYFIGSGHLKDISKMSGKKIIGGEKIGSGSSVAQK